MGTPGRSGYLPVICYVGPVGAALLCRCQRKLQLHVGSFNKSPEKCCSDLSLPGVYQTHLQWMPFLVTSECFVVPELAPEGSPPLGCEARTSWTKRGLRDQDLQLQRQS